jgi:hypothetical protein
MGILLQRATRPSNRIAFYRTGNAMAELRCIVYLSTACTLMSVAQLEALLIESRELNLKNAITGVLLYSDGNFMQYFEGPAQAVLDTYARIKASQQHKDIIELMHEPILRRNFEDWLMGFAVPHPGELMALFHARWGAPGSGSPADLSATPGIALLHDFWRRSAH